MIYVGVVKKLDVDKDYSDIYLDDTDDPDYVKTVLPQDLVGKMVVLWKGGNYEFGVDEIELEGDIAHFVRHIAGSEGYLARFHDDRLSLDFLEYMGAQILLPKKQTAGASS